MILEKERSRHISELEKRLAGLICIKLSGSFIQNGMCASHTGLRKAVERIWNLLIATVKGSEQRSGLVTLCVFKGRHGDSGCTSLHGRMKKKKQELEVRTP